MKTLDDLDTLKTQELTEDELNQVTGGGTKAGDPIFDGVTVVLKKWRDAIWNYMPKSSLFAYVDAAAEKQFFSSRWTAIKAAIDELNGYYNMYCRLSSETFCSDLKKDLADCLQKSAS